MCIDYKQEGRETIKRRGTARRVVSALTATSIFMLNIIAPVCAIKQKINNDSKINTDELDCESSKTDAASIKIIPITTCATTVITTSVRTTTKITTTTTCATETDEVIEEETTIYDDNEESETLETEKDSYYENDETYYGWFEATYYEGGYGTIGYSETELISGYSIASNILEQGTLVRIVGSGLDGVYRVDDRGGMSDNVIDVYYQYGDTPDYFQLYGRLDIEVYIIE